MHTPKHVQRLCIFVFQHRGNARIVSEPESQRKEHGNSSAPSLLLIILLAKMKKKACVDVHIFPGFMLIIIN